MIRALPQVILLVIEKVSRRENRSIMDTNFWRMITIIIIIHDTEIRIEMVGIR